LIAGDVERCGRDHVGRKIGRDERRVQAFGGRRSGPGFEGEQVSDSAGGSGKFEIGSVDDSLGERCAARDVNGLGAVMSFMTAGTGGRARLGSA
jgi:hypothetical protein